MCMRLWLRSRATVCRTALWQQPQVRVEARRDPERLLQLTEALASEAHGPVGPVDLFPRHGYSMGALVADAKFKLIMMLREANVDHTDYGRQMFMHTRATRAPRLDTFTTEQLNC